MEVLMFPRRNCEAIKIFQVFFSPRLEFLQVFHESSRSAGTEMRVDPEAITSARTSFWMVTSDEAG